MIKKENFLPVITSMSEEQKDLTVRQAEEWMERYPALRAAVTSWQDAPVKDFDEGLVLCSCLRRAQSFVTSAYKLNAQRCLRMINDTLAEIIRIAGPTGPRTEQQKKKRKIKAFIPPKPMPDETGTVRHISEKERKQQEAETMNEEQQNDRFRPQNLKDYIHLLPADIQQECADVKTTYYMPLREYRSRLESLAQNPQATTEQRAKMARKLADAENKLAKFWERVDLAYQKATSLVPEQKGPKAKEVREYTRAEIEAIEDETIRERFKKMRIYENKKYLRRTDLPECDETRRQLLLRAGELRDWNVHISNAQRLNLEKYGAILSEDTPDDGTLFN